MKKFRLALMLSLTVMGNLPQISGIGYTAERYEFQDEDRIKEANLIALSFFDVLPAEAQSSIGLKEKATTAVVIDRGYTERTEGAYKKLLGYLQEQERDSLHDPLLKAEISVAKDVVINTLRLLELNRQHGRLSVFIPFNYCETNDAIDPISYIFNGLSSLVIQKYPEEAVGRRLAAYVEGNGESLPFIEGVEQEIRHLIFKYKGNERGILYPCIQQIQEILDKDRLKSILEWIGQNIPEEKKDLLPLLEKQVKRYEKFVREVLLPNAPQDAKLPEDIYRTLLKLHGVHDDPETLMKRARQDFDDLYNQYQDVAREVAALEGLNFDDPVKVLQHLESTKSLTSPEEIMAMYKNIQEKIEEWIKRDNLLTLSTKSIVARIGNAAEEAIMPVPHVNVPYFVGNDGSVTAEYVLCDLKSHGNAPVAYPLTAHEEVPGHVHQFGRMLEAYLAGELDLIQAAVASNSTNCEGWAHYVEYLMCPYFDKAAQLGALRDQLLRAARLFLDPELNLGRITFDDVVKFYVEKVGFSESVALSEAKRYSYMMPGQATTYRYGCLKIMDARKQLEEELQEKFTLQKFHDTFLSFGLLPIDHTIEFIKEKMQKASPLH